MKWRELFYLLGKGELTTLRAYLSELSHPFWSRHYTLSSPPAAKPMALIGESRVAEIEANVVFPYLAGQGVEVWKAYSALPARLDNRRVATAGTRLFGDDTRRPRFLRSLCHQQGLLQIYEDFCMQDNSDCARCPFPEQMRSWS